MGNVLLSDKNTFSFIAPENGAKRHSPKDCGEARLKFLIELFSKSSRCPEAEPLGALRRVRKIFYRQAYFWKFENFLQEKKFSRTDYLSKLSSKIIRWMIFDGRICSDLRDASLYTGTLSVCHALTCDSPEIASLPLSFFIIYIFFSF